MKKMNEKTHFETHDGRILSRKEYNEYLKKLIGYVDDVESYLPDLSQEELAYRRGFHQGFVAARHNPNVTENEIRTWRNSIQDNIPIKKQINE